MSAPLSLPDVSLSPPVPEPAPVPVTHLGGGDADLVDGLQVAFQLADELVLLLQGQRAVHGERHQLARLAHPGRRRQQARVVGHLVLTRLTGHQEHQLAGEQTSAAHSGTEHQLAGEQTSAAHSGTVTGQKFACRMLVCEKFESK